MSSIIFFQDSDKVKIVIKYGDFIYKEKKKFIQKTQYYLDKKVKYVDKMSFTNFILYHLDGTNISIGLVMSKRKSKRTGLW